MRRAVQNFRIFIDAATLKHSPPSSRSSDMPNFRIFIDAATLKQFKHRRRFACGKAFPHLYRCGHIEARGVGVCHLCGRREFPHLYRCGHIEAANSGSSFRRAQSKFPHLYRCGHIEARARGWRHIAFEAHFRIFIDAATLKL